MNNFPFSPVPQLGSRRPFTMEKKLSFKDEPDDTIHDRTHPLGIYKNLAAFKLYMSDVGLLTRKAGITAYDIVSGNDYIFIGAITENYIANVLEMNRYKLYYWTSGGEAELDFIIEQEGQVVPVEVKAREHTKSRSLSTFLGKYPSQRSIRFSGRNFGWENGIESIPFYAAWLA